MRYCYEGDRGKSCRALVHYLIVFTLALHQNQKYLIYPEGNSVCDSAPVSLVEIKSMYTVQIVAACNMIR